MLREFLRPALMECQHGASQLDFVDSLVCLGCKLLLVVALIDLPHENVERPWNRTFLIVNVETNLRMWTPGTSSTRTGVFDNSISP